VHLKFVTTPVIIDSTSTQVCPRADSLYTYLGHLFRLLRELILFRCIFLMSV